MGPLCVTQSNLTHQLTDPTQHKWKNLELTWPNPTRLQSASLWSNCHWLTLSLFTPSDRFAAPVRSAVKWNLTAWCNQVLSNRALNHHHQVRVAGEGRRVVAPPCPRSTARLQRSPVGRVESFRSWSSHLFRGRPGGRRHVRSGGRLNDTLMWSWRAMFAGVMSL